MEQAARELAEQAGEREAAARSRSANTRNGSTGASRGARKGARAESHSRLLNGGAHARSEAEVGGVEISLVKRLAGSVPGFRVLSVCLGGQGWQGAAKTRAQRQSHRTN